MFYNFFLGGESFAKGDIWFLWLAESKVSSIDEIKLAQSSVFNMLNRLNIKSNIALSSQAILEADRKAFMEAKMKSGYPFPWFRGILWQVKLLLFTMIFDYYDVSSYYITLFCFISSHMTIISYHIISRYGMQYDIMLCDNKISNMA